MEDLRILPLAMFFIGALLVYAGFQDRSPSQIVSDALHGGGNQGKFQPLYGPNTNPVYAGVQTYNSPVPYGGANWV
jgi:hypothetical protein